MIYYDSHNWWSLARFQGSVFPRAFKLALPSAVAAYVLGHVVLEGHLSLPSMDKLEESNSVYSGFTFVLGFSLVFRTAESYHRFWTAATSCHEMGSEWSDCCSSLIAFAQTSKKPHEKVIRFTHTVIRLFCLLHAMALEEIAELKDGHCPLIDIEGFNQRDLRMLLSEEVQGKRVQVVLCWIKLLIIESIESGLIAVPAPIVTRVFQELGLGLVEYHKAQQVVIWPFPFPYTQMNLVLIYIYMAVTPLVIGTWGLQPWMCAVCTLFSCVCMVGLDLIASELENPFGDDDNDLPVREIHMQMTRVLLAQLNKKTWRVPRLLPTAVLDHPTLVLQSGIVSNLDEKEESLAAAHRCRQACQTRMKGMLPFVGTRDRLRAQLEWASPSSSASPAHARQVSRFGAWLKLPFRDKDFLQGRRSVDIGGEEEDEDYGGEPHGELLRAADGAKDDLQLEEYCSEGIPQPTYSPGSPATQQQSCRSMLSIRNATSIRSSGGWDKLMDTSQLEPMERANLSGLYRNSESREDMMDRGRSAGLQKCSTWLSPGEKSSNPDRPDALEEAYTALAVDTLVVKLQALMNEHFRRLEALMERQTINQQATFQWQTSVTSTASPAGQFRSANPNISSTSTCTGEFIPVPSLVSQRQSPSEGRPLMLRGPGAKYNARKPEVPEHDEHHSPSSEHL